MKLPFILPPGRLPVIVRRPKIKTETLADGTTVHVAHNVSYLNLESERGLFDIGFMLDFRQFGFQSSEEQFTTLALQRKLAFSDEVDFPDLKTTGQLFPVNNTDEKRVWATIPETVVLTSKFTPYDLHDEGMAINELGVLRERIEQVTQGCQNVDVKEIINRFQRFTIPHVTDIRSALKNLESLGLVRKYIKEDRLNRRALVNMRMIAATRSWILRGMIDAEDRLNRVDGSAVSFSVDLNLVDPPAKRIKSTSTGRRKKPKKADYQSKYHAENEKLTKAEKLIAKYEGNGYLTQSQFTELGQAQEDPTIPRHVREALESVFESAHTDPLTEIPIIADTKKDKRNA